MTNRPHCRVEARPYQAHSEQIIAGFCELARSGVIDLEFVRGPVFGQSARSSHQDRVQIRAIVDGRRVAYDTYDDGRDGAIDVRLPDVGLVDFDFYFKRSFDPLLHTALASRCRVMPLGLNYLVSPNGVRLRDRLRLFDGQRVIKRLAGRDRKIGQFESPPHRDHSPRVLFMTRAWDPQTTTIDEQARPDIVAVNESRAELIRVARREFGDRFYGGLVVDEFSRRVYGDCLLSSAAAGSKHAFLAALRRSSICVATTGLWGSVGWKMAEYVAASKAVVSEPLRYALPGSFAPEQNYLEFSSAGELCAAVERLLVDATLRYEFMRANWAYYNGWVRPDALVLNTVTTVLEEG
ncbi:MAG: hypothetical protein ACLQUT_01550 [Thermoleophilia bacterium]